MRRRWPGVSTGAWIVVAAVVLASGLGMWRLATDGRFRGTHALRTPAASVMDGESVTVVAPAGADLVATVGHALGERATLLQFSSAFCAPCRATRRVLGEVTGARRRRRPRRGGRRAAPRRDPRLRDPPDADHRGARRLGDGGHEGDRCPHPRPGPDRAGASVISRYGCRGHIVRHLGGAPIRTRLLSSSCPRPCSPSAAQWTTAACARRCVECRSGPSALLSHKVHQMTGLCSRWDPALGHGPARPASCCADHPGET